MPTSADANTLLLLQMQGNNNEPYFLDESLYKWSMGSTNGAVTDTDNPKFGISSAKFSDVDAHVNIILPNVLAEFLNGDFTIDYWLRYYTGGYNSGYNITVCGSQPGDNDDPDTGSFAISYIPKTAGIQTKALDFSSGNATHDGQIYFIASAIPDLNEDTWVHHTIVKTGATHYIFVNGVSQAFSEYSDITSGIDLVYPIMVGMGGDGYNDPFIVVHIAEFRISNNVRWSVNFTPPSAPYVDINPIRANTVIDSYTKLLLHCDTGIAGTIDYSDSSPSAHNMSAHFSMAYNAPLGVNYAGVFNQAVVLGMALTGYLSYGSDPCYIFTAQSSDFNFNDGDFTIDCWFSSVSTGYNFYPYYQYVDSNNYIEFYVNNTSIVFTAKASSSVIALSSTSIGICDGAWHHIAVERKGTSAHCIKFFVDGILQSSTDSTDLAATALPSLASQLRIGYSNTSGVESTIVAAYDEVRVSKGIARYSGSFLPPIVPYSTSGTGSPLVDIEGSFTAVESAATFASIGAVDGLGTLLLKCQAAVFNTTGALGSLGTLGAFVESATFSGQSLTGIIGSLTSTEEAATLVVSGIVGATGTVTTLLAPCSALFLGMVTTVGVLDATAKSAIVNIAGAVEILGTLGCLAEVELFAATGMSDVTGVLTAIVPHPSLYITTADIFSGLTYCINLFKKSMVSQFTNYNYNSMCVVNGVSFGASSSGLFKLVGDTDNTKNIDATITWPLAKLGVSNSKQVRSVRCLGRFPSDLVVTINDSDSGFWESKAVTKDTSSIFYFPFTTRGRHIQVSIMNDSGADFTLDQVDLTYQALVRA